jgi:hypothetical protein
MVLIDVPLNLIQFDFITLVRRILSVSAILIEEGQVYCALPTLVLHSESENDHEQTEHCIVEIGSRLMDLPNKQSTHGERN